MKDSQSIVTPSGVDDIKLDTPDWFQWLTNNSSFSYRSDTSDYTCNKRSNGKWYASKRKGARSQGSKSLGQEYLGASDKVTAAKLEEVARKFALPDREYWYLKHPKPKQSQDTNSGCTTDFSSLQGTTTTKDEKSERYLAELEEELRQAKYKNSDLQNEINRLNRLGQDYGKDTVARLNQKHRDALNEIERLKGQAESYKRQAQKLKTQLEQVESDPDLTSVLDMVNEYEIRYETIKPNLPKPPEGVTRNWTEFWRFKQWLESSR